MTSRLEREKTRGQCQWQAHEVYCPRASGVSIKYGFGALVLSTVSPKTETSSIGHVEAAFLLQPSLDRRRWPPWQCFAPCDSRRIEARNEKDEELSCIFRFQASMSVSFHSHSPLRLEPPSRLVSQKFGKSPELLETSQNRVHQQPSDGSATQSAAASKTRLCPKPSENRISAGLGFVLEVSSLSTGYPKSRKPNLTEA